MKRVGIIGYGTIGKFIADNLQEDPEVDLRFVYRRSLEANHQNLRVVNKVSREDFQDLDLVIEAAGPQVAQKNALQVLQYTDFMIFSATALADEDFMNRAQETCEKHKTRIFIPHGAILGLDGVFDGRSLLTAVKITTIKTPKGFGLESDTQTTLYEGSTRGACLAYPKNVNVHAAVALAGLGFDKTSSAIVADPDIKGNTHIISIEGEGIKFEIKVESKPQGTVTGKYTPYSGLGSIQRLLDKKPGIHIA